MNAELEKEADKYADEHAFRVPYDGSNNFYDDVDFKASKEGYLAGANPREKRIAELEKENTELRRNEFNARSCLELQQSQDKAILNYMGEQLTKAKEIIKEFVEWANWQGSGCPSFKSRLDKAEQFLSEVKKC